MIDERAVIHPRSSIAAGVTIGPYAMVGEGVSVDEGTTIGPHVVLYGPTHIGKHNHIHAFACLGGDPQDKKYAGEKSLLQIGDHNTIREYVTINRGTALGRGVTTIGDHNWIMAYCHIAHDCVLGTGVVMANGASLAGHVAIEDHAGLGGFVLVHQHCRIGAYAFVGMGCAITKDVPPYILVAADPARPRGINVVGLQRHGFNKEQLAGLRRAYRLLYRSGRRLEEVRGMLGDMATEQPEFAVLCRFLEEPGRGILR
jgi:UDP-N-acetylglucosamine acyltransferase